MQMNWKLQVVTTILPILDQFSPAVCKGSYDGYFRIKMKNLWSDPWDFQGKEKMQYLFLLTLPVPRGGHYDPPQRFFFHITFVRNELET